MSDGKQNEPIWFLTKDGDKTCIELFSRHYTYQAPKDGKEKTSFIGPGQVIALRTERADAIFVWRRFIDDSGQDGINCAVFRNESPHKASELVRQADAIADFVWPCERHYTYVNAAAVRGTCPGYCFIRAGWKRCGMTKSGKLILHRISRPIKRIAA